MRCQRRSVVTRVGLILLAWSLTACSYIPWFGREQDPTPPTELTDFSPEVDLSVLWSVRATRGTEGRRLFLVPAFANGRLYAADARGHLVALTADNGRLLWERETGLAFSSGPAIAGDRLVLGTTQGELAAFADTDGRELWRTQLSSEILSIPRLTPDGRLVVHTLDDSVHAIDAATGAEVWRSIYPAPVLTLRGNSTPAIMADGIIVGLSGGKLVKLDLANGAPQWEVTITRPSGRSELARIADIDAEPIVLGNTLFVGTYHGDLAAVDATSGTVLWRRELSAHAGLAADANDLFITDSEDQVWGANASDGAGRWKQERLRHRQLTAPALVGHLIAVGDLEGYVHLLARNDGRLVGRTRLTKKGTITARPLAVGGRLYVYADDGTLAALTIGTRSVPRTASGGTPSAPDGQSAVPAATTTTATP